MPAGIMGTSNARNFLLFLVILLVVIWNVEVWNEKKLSTPGAVCVLCQLHQHTEYLSNAFQSGYNCTLCQNHKAHCGAAESEHWGRIWPSNPVSPTQEGRLCGWAAHTASLFLTVFWSPVPQIKDVSFRWRFILLRFSKTSFNTGLGKPSVLNSLQASGHRFCFRCHVNETFRGCILSRSKNARILHDDLTLDVPEPANVKMIVSEFALMVSDSRRGVTFTEIHCLNSIIQMLHNFCKLLDYLHCKNYLSLNVFLYSPLICHLSFYHYDCNNSWTFSSHGFWSQFFQ